MRHPFSMLIASVLTMGPIDIAIAAPVDGCYVLPHAIAYLGDPLDAPDGVTSVADHFGIRQDSDSTYEFDLLVVGDQGHVCGATGRLEIVEKGSREILRRMPDEADEAMRTRGAPLCKLTAEIKPKTIVIHANPPCDDLFACGAGMGVGERSFRRSSVVPAKPRPPCFQK